MSSSSTSSPKPLHSFQPYEGAEGEFFPNPKELTVDEEVMVAQELLALSETKPSVGERKLRWKLRDQSSLQEIGAVGFVRNKAICRRDEAKMETKRSDLSAEGEFFPNPKELTVDEEVMVAEELLALSETKPSVGERKLRWKLRDRSSRQLSKSSKPNMVGGPSSNTMLERGKQPIKTALKNEETVPKLPKFTIELKPQEISDDMFALTGKTIPKKVKRKAKNVRKIDQIFPGRSLENRRINHYKVFEDKRKAK